ncbi:MAG: DUF434 domain-containing protein [Planctomycetota bacterium]|nr:MAG: DUF434 domain-containing protein [Planctomycetota bacterium]
MPGGGPHPRDRELFAPERLPTLRRAAEELRFLRERGYALPGALKLVGDRHQLRERQRLALSRATSEAQGVRERLARRVPEDAPPPPAVWVDGFNVVITLETALRGGVLVGTCEGGLRDLAGVHGTYRLSEVSARAIALAERRLAARGWRAVPTRWLLDAPVSNTGRLAARIRAHAREAGLDWSVEVVPDPDALLAAPAPPHVAATSDAAVQDRCGPWIDLAAEAIRADLPGAWIVDLFPR